MKHVSWFVGLFVLAFIFAVSQYFITGVYGRLLFCPIYLMLINIYGLSQIRSKVLNK